MKDTRERKWKVRQFKQAEWNIKMRRKYGKGKI